MRRLLTVAAAAVLLFQVVPAEAAKSSKFVELGTDPAGDGVPALDVTFLQVGKTGTNLEIRIGIDTMLPALAGYPELPGIEWVFDVKGRTFVAEAVASTDGPLFFLFEEKDGAFEQLESPKGTYDPADGYASILVPLKTIGARSGTVISGADGLENGDVDAHVHLLATTVYPDGMQTTKNYVLP